MYIEHKLSAKKKTHKNKPKKKELNNRSKNIKQLNI